MSKTKVLVVDDSMTMRALLCGALERVKDVEVVGLANGAAEAREMVKTHRPHVMTLDIEMPGMDGFELANEIRTNGAWTNTPLVALSSFSSRADLEKGRNVGFRDYIVKLDRDALLDSLSHTLATVRGAA